MARKKDTLLKEECAKFRWSRAIVGLVSLVKSCLCGCFVGLMFFSRGNFVGPKLFLVGISWVQIFFSWIFRVSEDFSRECFVGPIFFMVAKFVIQRLSVSDYMRRSDRKQKYTNTSQTEYFQIDFNNCQFYLYYKGTSSTKSVMLLIAAFICINCYI